jgi:hypothetical protein
MRLGDTDHRSEERRGRTASQSEGRVPRSATNASVDVVGELRIGIGVAADPPAPSSTERSSRNLVTTFAISGGDESASSSITFFAGARHL